MKIVDFLLVFYLLDILLFQVLLIKYMLLYIFPSCQMHCILNMLLHHIASEDMCMLGLDAMRMDLACLFHCLLCVLLFLLCKMCRFVVSLVLRLQKILLLALLPLL